VGLFSSPRRELGRPALRFPIRLHSEDRVPVAAAAALARIGRRIVGLGGTAVQDPRVVGVLLVAALGALLMVTVESVR
jgi:hypothetical protein